MRPMRRIMLVPVKSHPCDRRMSAAPESVEVTPNPAPAGVATEPKLLEVPHQVPERIGKYYVVHEVGRGSTGTVYLSHDPYYGRDVAIKVYTPPAVTTPRAATRARMFLAEAQMVGMLQHPNILPIYDAGEEDGRCYVVTEHVHGARTLSAYCRPGNLLPIDEVVEIIFKCAKALHYAHTRGVIHRDIKPSNILLTQEGDVRIIDFGIALVADSDVSRIEGIAGSPAYMSPEQVQGLELDARSDLYSLGAVMYEMLCGQRPFRAGKLGKLLHQIVQTPPEPLRTVRAEIPEELEEVVDRVLQKDPDKRYRTGAEFAADLTRVHQKLRASQAQIDDEERFAVLRKLRFFHDFSHGEIREVMRAAHLDRLPAGRAGAAPRRHRRPLLRRGDRQGAAQPRRRTGRAHRNGRLLRRSRIRRRLATGLDHRGGRAAHPAQGHRDAARAVVDFLPAALPQGVPARADRPAAARQQEERLTNPGWTEQ